MASVKIDAASNGEREVTLTILSSNSNEVIFDSHLGGKGGHFCSNIKHEKAIEIINALLSAIGATETLKAKTEVVEKFVGYELS